MLSNSIYDKGNDIQRIARLINGTILGIVRPTKNHPQKFIHNRRMRKQVLKFQTFNATNGLI